VVDTSANSSVNLSTAASSKGASPTSRSVAADLFPSAPSARTRAESGEPPHLAAHPPQDVHSVSLSAVDPVSVSTAAVSQVVPGTRVEVRTGYDRSWAAGFEVIDAGPDGYRLRRLSDGRVLPRVFPADDVRRDRRDANMWWI
jgi:hypothetical protein